MFIIGYLFDNDDPSFSVFKLQPSWSIHVPGPRWSDAVRAAGALDMSTFDHHMWSTDMYSRCEPRNSSDAKKNSDLRFMIKITVFWIEPKKRLKCLKIMF